MGEVEDAMGKQDILDLGDGHTLQFCAWAPDRELNPQYADLPDDDRIGGIISHTKPDGSLCKSAIWFDCEVTRRVFGDHPRWKVESRDPLTLSPSFLCGCGDHGWVKAGRWVKA